MARKRKFQPRLELDKIETVRNDIEEESSDNDLSPWQNPSVGGNVEPPPLWYKMEFEPSAFG